MAVVDMSAADITEETPEEEVFDPKVRWVLPQRVDSVAFVGRDVLAVAHDLYISFLNVRTGGELVYVAAGERSGDGVDAVAGHRASVFAFAEKVKHPRIFVVTYPSFLIIAQLKDTDVNRYKGLCLMENDLVSAFSGFPDYLVSVWSWRTGQRLLSVPSGVVRRTQLYLASRTHTLVCQCWGEGLAVWEVALCFRRCLLLRRAREPPAPAGWRVAAPPLVAIAWSAEGALYALDPAARLYSMMSDGIAMVAHLDWGEELSGTNKPCMCAFGNGLLVYGPDHYLRSLKKAEQKWKVVWQESVGGEGDEVLRLVSSATGDAAAAWTRSGLVYRILGDEDHPEICPYVFKQRNIMKIELISPEFTHVATMNDVGMLCVYEVHTAKLVHVKYMEGTEVSFQASPAEALLAVVGAVGRNYGVALVRFDAAEGLSKVSSMCLTHQIVSRVAFSDTGRQLMVAAMSAGHVFILKVAEDYTLSLTRYAELGRGLVDCFLMPVSDVMRAFSLVLFSDKFPVGERVVCINAETGKDNKFAGKMQGPYAQLLPLSTRDTMLAIPHLSKQYHVLKLEGAKGVTVSVRMGPIYESGHEMRLFYGLRTQGALLTFGADGALVLRRSDAPPEYEFRLAVSHRYEPGVRQAAADARGALLAHLGHNGTAALTLAYRRAGAPPPDEPRPAPLEPELHLLHPQRHHLTIIHVDDKNYLDLQEEKKVHEEAMDYKQQRADVVKTFQQLQAQVVALLEENIAERPLHQLSLSEFNLHQEHKKERLKQAEVEREEIRLRMEARIRAQDKVTAWIKRTCWDAMVTPRVKLFAIFSHYQVENYPTLPLQRDQWPELQQTAALRSIEADNDPDVFRPWEEEELVEEVSQTRVLRESVQSVQSAQKSAGSAAERVAAEEAPEGEPHVLAGTITHRFVPVPPFMIPQTLAYTYLQMNWLQEIVKLNVQNMRLWFNKQFDELMAQKKREVGLVEERNARLRFILEELNKLSDLRGSFHHLLIEIRDPQWRQEEQPHKLTKVDPEECSIPPYISPSQIVIVPPDPGPKDDFRERALNEMMDGVLEKLWHEEIKKPIPKPQCMLDKEPEHWNEEDLRAVFDYEAKVKFRNEERDKYRKMLHAEYAKLSQVLSEAVVKFNMRVKETWLMKLRVDSVIGQENLNLMRLRRTNLDRAESAEALEEIRAQTVQFEREAETLGRELAQAQEQSGEVQAAYDALAARDRHADRGFKNNFSDQSPVILDTCYKFFKKRPKWHQRATMTPAVLNELAGGVLSGVRPPLLHPDCVDYFKGVEQLDAISNMPQVMDEVMWATMCRLRRAKIDYEIRMRALVLETAYVDGAAAAWHRALAARRAFLGTSAQRLQQHRAETELLAINKTVQLVLPAGQVEIDTTGHMHDYDDATLLPRQDVQKINELILRVGAIKLRMMRRQIEFRKVILAKEWEHAQMKMKLRHMEQELYSYRRLKIPKELQRYLKGKELGYTDEDDYVSLEKEMAANKMSISRALQASAQRAEELEVKTAALEEATQRVDRLVGELNVKVSEKRLNEDPLEPIRVRRIFRRRMETLVMRSRLIREVQANHTTIVLLQTQLELLRLKTYPTLASFRTIN